MQDSIFLLIHWLQIHLDLNEASALLHVHKLNLKFIKKSKINKSGQKNSVIETDNLCEMLTSKAEVILNNTV